MGVGFVQGWGRMVLNWGLGWGQRWTSILCGRKALDSFEKLLYA